jgi:hypothetical protein
MGAGQQVGGAAGEGWGDLSPVAQVIANDIH